MNKQWEKISNIPNYLVSNDGEIMNTATNKVLGSKQIRSGYISVKIQNKMYRVHRLVAENFIKNSDETKTVVNHKDGNKLNNNVNNLEWVSASENVQHAVDTGLISKTERRVIQMDLQGKVIKIHNTLRGAGKETGIDAGGIAKVCKGNRKTAGGFTWKFADENPNEKEIDLTYYKEIKEFPNYMINNKGIIYSKPYKKIMKMIKNNEGYYNIQLSNNGNRKTYLVHRLVAEYFVEKPKIEKEHGVYFKDKNKENISAENLQWK